MFEYLTYSEQKALFSVSEAARVLNVSYSTVLRLIHSGKMPAMISSLYRQDGLSIVTETGGER